MTTVVSPSNSFLSPHAGHVPRGGILLNAITNSPGKSSYYLAPPSPANQTMSIGSNSSSASSSSSTDDVASSSEGNGMSGRKIRFAPLPDPRRLVLVTEQGTELPLPNPYPEDTGTAKFSSSTALKTPPNSYPASSYLHSDALGLCLDDPDSGPNTETNTIAGTDDGGSALHLPTGAKKQRRSSTSSGSKWGSKSLLRPLLRLPKAAPIKTSFSPEEVLTLGTINLFRSSSRESNTSTCSARSKGDSGLPLQRHMSASAAEEKRRGSPRGYPLAPVISESGTASTARHTAAGGTGTTGSVGKQGTRMLNGRVYGRRGFAAANPFANAPDETGFVEWGHGGMGSVIGGAAGARKAAGGAGAVATRGPPADDDDDGSGMGWVRRRRLQREQEAREQAAQGHTDGVGGEGEGNVGTDGDARGSPDTPAIQIHAASPMTEAAPPSSAEHTAPAVRRGGEADDVATGTPTPPQPDGAKKEVAHATAVVNIPASHRPAHHHHHSSQSSVPALPVQQSDAPASVPSPTEGSSSSASTSSASDAEDEDDDEGGEKDADEDETPDSEAEEDELEEEIRKTSLCAGVEKISRHKE